MLLFKELKNCLFLLLIIMINSHKLFFCQIVDITDYNFFLIFYNQPIEDKIKKIDEIRKITTG